MSLCPNTGKACECQPQDGVMCPHGPTPVDWMPWPAGDPVKASAPVMDALIRELMRLVDEHGRARWDTGCAESAHDKLEARRYDREAVEARENIEAVIRAIAAAPLSAPAVQPLSEEQMEEISARVASLSLHATRVHELGGTTITILEPKGLIELARAIESAHGITKEPKNG